MPALLRIGSLAGLFLLATASPGLFASAQAPKSAAPEAKARKPIEVTCKVDGPTTILSLTPSGSRVKRGELVCELESFALRERLARQEDRLKSAQTAYDNARLAREAAELGVQEYLEGTYKQELQSLNGKIALAETGLKRAEKRLADSKRLYEKRIVPRERVSTDEVGVQRARLVLEQAQGKKQTLEKFTREKKVKTLQLEVEKARAQELLRQAERDREQSARDQLNQQIAGCRIFAPADGRLSYAPPIEPAADVNKGQLLFRLLPDDEPKQETPRRSPPEPE